MPAGLKEDRARAVAFLRALATRVAGLSQELPFGVAVFDEQLPLVWDLNFLWIDAADELTGASLTAVADAVQGGAGLAHRQAIVADDSSGARLARELQPLGWTALRHVLMAHRREPDRPSADVRVEEVPTAWKRRFADAYLREDGHGLPEETIEQLLARDDRFDAVGARWFGVSVDGEPAASADLYADGGVAQIESVMTRPAYRERGLARAVVLRALAAAQADGRDLVFLEAEEDDWPPALYRKLGFDPIGRLWLLRRAA